MNLLVGVPMLTGSEHCRAMLSSVAWDVDVLIIDNGADEDVKIIIEEFEYKWVKAIKVIRNKNNVYVNPAWNQIMEYFLNHEEYDQLVIMNSDFIMDKQWYYGMRDGISCIPTDGSHIQETVVTEGTPGVFIHMNRRMVEMVYPIPETLKVWFGDNWIYDKLRKAGVNTTIIPGLIGHHYHNGSQTISRVPNIAEIIEQDKLEWAKICG